MSETQARYNTVCTGIPREVKLIAVSKTRSIEQIRDVYELGHRAFGENRPQELKEKAPSLPADIEWHFIGHLQTNKVKQVVPYAHLIHSIDSMRLLDEVNKRAGAVDKVQHVLLQVHIAEEAAKHGLVAHTVEDIIRTSLSEHDHVHIAGLMGMATFTEDNDAISREFTRLKDLFDSLQATFSKELPAFQTLSMGMSGDAQLAISAGSTMVRIGTAIFGKRQYL